MSDPLEAAGVPMRLLRVLCILSLSLLTACGGDGILPDVSLSSLLGPREVSVERARELVAISDYAGAEEVLRAQLSQQPDDTEALLLLGEVLLDLKRPSNALDFFGLLSGVEGMAAVAHQGTGLAFVELGDLQSALVELESAVVADPELWRAHNALGLVYDSEKKWENAQTAYEAALVVQPESSLVYNNWGMSLLLQGRHEEAAEKFKEALRLDRSLTNAEGNLRLNYALDGNYALSLAGVSKADLPDALNNVGYAAMMRGDYDAAEAYLTRALELSAEYHRKAAANLDQLNALREAAR